MNPRPNACKAFALPLSYTPLCRDGRVCVLLSPGIEPGTFAVSRQRHTARPAQLKRAAVSLRPPGRLVPASFQHRVPNAFDCDSLRLLCFQPHPVRGTLTRHPHRLPPMQANETAKSCGRRFGKDSRDRTRRARDPITLVTNMVLQKLVTLPPY